MTVVGVTHCESCHAIVNANWPSCAVCHKPLASLGTLEPGCVIWWKEMDGQVRGPAKLGGTFEDLEQVWCWFTFCARDYLIQARLIVQSQPALANRRGDAA